MSSTTNIKQYVSSFEPLGVNIGDEWLNQTTGQLFKRTIEELKQTFEKNDLEKLQNLYFDFDSNDLESELDTELENELTDEQDTKESAITDMAD